MSKNLGVGIRNSLLLHPRESVIRKETERHEPYEQQQTASYNVVRFTRGKSSIGRV